MRNVIRFMLLMLVVAGASAAPLYRGARAYVDPRGFIIKVPDGWEATPIGKDEGPRGVRVRAADSSEAVVVFGDSSNAGPTILSHLVAQTFSASAHLVKSQAEGESESREYTLEGHGAERLRLLFHDDQGAYTVWGMRAADGRFEHDKAQLVDVLQSFHFLPTGGGEPTIEMHTATGEGAFEIGFPAGWDVDAKTIRVGSMGVYNQVQGKSPQRTAAVTGWAPYPMTFAPPNPIGMRFGRLPGTKFMDHGVGYMVEPYMAPHQFLKFLASRDPRMKGMEVGDAVSVPVGPSGATQDQCEYMTVTIPEENASGGALVRTYGWSTNGVGIWLGNVTVWLGKTGHEEEGRSAFLTAVRTLRINPQWQAQLRQENAVQVQSLSIQYQQLHDIVARNVAGQEATQEGNVRRGDNMALGQDTYVDTDGAVHTIQLDATSNYYWKTPQGTVVGTSTAQPPGPDVTRLLHVP